MPWIDSSIDDAIATSGVTAALSAEDAASPSPSPPVPPSLEETGDFGFDDWTLPPDSKRSKAWFLVLPIIVVAFVVLWVAVFIDSDEDPVTPLVTSADTSTSTPAPTTTVIKAAAEAPTTTSSTTTTIFFPAASSWDAVGESIPTSELTLKAAGIGPIDFGTNISEAAGALVASLGTAQSAGLDPDACPGATWYWLRWDDLLGLFNGYTPAAEFIGFAYEDDGVGEPDPILETLSGLQLGDTVENLQSTYTSYTVSFEIIDGRDYFRLSDGGELLLWGPVTNAEPQGTVQGIYSPDACASEN
jgi:hypothetical protein